MKTRLRRRCWDIAPQDDLVLAVLVQVAGVYSDMVNVAPFFGIVVEIGGFCEEFRIQRV